MKNYICTCAVFERDIARYMRAHVLQANGLDRRFVTHHSPKLVRVLEFSSRVIFESPSLTVFSCFFTAQWMTRRLSNWTHEMTSRAVKQKKPGRVCLSVHPTHNKGDLILRTELPVGKTPSSYDAIALSTSDPRVYIHATHDRTFVCFVMWLCVIRACIVQTARSCCT